MTGQALLTPIEMARVDAAAVAAGAPVAVLNAATLFRYWPLT